MQRLRPTLVACLFAFITGAGLMGARQQSQSATRREPQFENEHVRVWKSVIMPRQPLSLHRHEHGRALIALTDGQLSVLDKDGKPIETYTWERGKAYWLDADPPGRLHADRNNTAYPIEVIVVELKRDK
jgi:quercetin dioxygenase-like cupin family protein